MINPKSFRVNSTLSKVLTVNAKPMVAESAKACGSLKVTIKVSSVLL